MVRDYAYHSARHRAHLDAPEAIGRKAGERAVARVNPVQPASGPMPVIFDPRVGSSLIGHLIGAIAGAAIARGTSFLLGKLGEQVFADGITITDDPHRPHGLRSRPFDGEGLPVSPTDIVRDGVLADLAARIGLGAAIGPGADRPRRARRIGRAGGRRQQHLSSRRAWSAATICSPASRAASTSPS